MFELNATYRTDTARRIASGTVGTPSAGAEAGTSTALAVLEKAPAVALTVGGKALAIVDSSMQIAKGGLQEAVAPERLIGAAAVGVPLTVAAGAAMTVHLLALPTAAGVAAVGVVGGAVAGKRIVRFVRQQAAAIRSTKADGPSVATVALPMPVKAKVKVLEKVS